MIYFWPMKNLLLLSLMTIVQLSSNIGVAHVLPLDFVLSKNVSQVAKPIITIEQVVSFKENSRTVSILEKWQIEGDKNLKLTAIGLGELKELFKIQYLYNGGTRTSLSGGSRVRDEAPRELFEKYLAVKSVESFKNYLKELGISSDIRLSRAAGAISFAIGRRSTKTLLSPQIWIDQDFFHLNKIRFANQETVEFSDYVDTANIHYPKTKLVTWGENQVTVSVNKVAIASSLSIKNFYPESIDESSEISLNGLGGLGQKIDSFYSRFR